MSNPTQTEETVQLTNRHGVGDAFGLILRNDLKAMLAWAPIAYANSDIEGVHQVRIALRRLRSALSTFAKAMPQNMCSSWSEEVRFFASALGPTRDLDVFINESLIPILGKTPFTQGEKMLLAQATARREQLYTEVQRTLDSPRYQTFVKDFSQWLEMRGWFQVDMPAKHRIKLTRSVRDFAAITLEKRFNKAFIMGENLALMTDEDLHELRIECKKIRYTTEFFSSLFPDNNLKSFIRNLKAIQNILGLMNDVAILPNTLNTLLNGTTDPDVLRFSGAVLGWRTREYDDMRHHLHNRWSDFVASEKPWG